MLLETHAGYRTPPPQALDDVEEGSEEPAPEDMPPMRRLALSAGGERLGVILLEDEPGGPLSRVRPAFLRMVAAATAADLQSARVIARARREVADD